MVHCVHTQSVTADELL